MRKINEYPIVTTYELAKQNYGSHEEVFKTFGPQEIEFLETHQFNGKIKLGDLYELVNKTSLYYQLKKWRKEKINTVTIISVIFLFIFAFISMYFEKVHISIFCVISILPIGIISTILKRNLSIKGYRFENQEVFKGLVYILLNDFGPKFTMDVKYDSSKVGNSNLVGEYRQNNRNIKVFKKNIFTLKLKPNDGINFLINDEINIKKQDWKKRSASGKTKYKSKTKSLERVSYKVEFDDQIYEQNNDQAEEINREIFETSNGVICAKSKLKLRTQPHNPIVSIKDLVIFLKQPFLGISKR